MVQPAAGPAVINGLKAAGLWGKKSMRITSAAATSDAGQANIVEFDLSDHRQQPKGPAAAKASLASPGTAYRQLVICPFTVVIDSREQLPYEFSGMTDAKTSDALVVPVTSKGLPSGDYSLDGYESAIAIERKSLEDLYGSVTHGRERFEREIGRLNEGYKFAAVVIEASHDEILHPEKYDPAWSNRTKPASVEGTVVAWSIRYPRVHWWPCGSRGGAEERVFRVLKRFWEEMGKGQ